MMRIPGRAAFVPRFLGEETDDPEGLFMGGPQGDDPIITVFGAQSSPPPKGAGQGPWARQAVTDGWHKVHPGIEPTLQELQAIQAVSLLESGYGNWGSPAVVKKCGQNGVGSNNWGSVQACKPCTEKKAYCCKNLDGQCPEGTFLCGDYDAKSNTDYQVCFYKYPTPADGAAAVVKHMTTHRPKTWAAMKTGDATQISTAMYDEHYYGGRGATREIRIEGHIKALTEAAQKIAAQLGEPVVVKRGGSSGVDGGSGETPPQGGSLGTIVVIGLVAAAVAGGVYLANK